MQSVASKKQVFFICGSMNQTTSMHQIAQALPADEFDCYFSTYYFQHPIITAGKWVGIVDRSILGGQFKAKSLAYLLDHNLNIDQELASGRNYDLVVTCSDLLISSNIRKKKIVLVQEGMTDPPTFLYKVFKKLGIQGGLSGCTAAFGDSKAYTKFCVASEGYKEFFVKKGCPEDRIVVTGIPNYDNCALFYNNDFPHKHYVLVATSDMRETLKHEDRKAFLCHCVDIAAGKQLIFKPHPNELIDRYEAEVHECCPGALIYPHGNTNHMIANCDVLVTQFSTVVYVGLALGKEVHSFFNLEELRKLTPLQNGGKSAQIIAQICQEVIANA